jgi:alpha-tubulin suppressor-like RCC1 family protein
MMTRNMGWLALAGIGLLSGAGCTLIFNLDNRELVLSGATGGGGATSSTAATASGIGPAAASTSGSEGSCSSAADCPGGDHGVALCESGVCGYACDQGYADCDAAPGCETDTNDNKDHCGSCGTKCSAYCSGTTCNDPVYVTAGYSHTCAILKDGSVWCWGENKFGELGDGTSVDRIFPVKVSLPGPAAQISAGGLYATGQLVVAHTCVVLKTGSVYCWGSNNNGQLGLGSTTSSTIPQLLGLAGIKQVELGGAHTCAVDMQGQLSCWGAGTSGQIGNGGSSAALSPVSVLTAIDQVSAGAKHTCAFPTDGTPPKCWGLNSKGQLGLNNTTDCTSPCSLAIGPKSIKNVVRMAAGAFHTCGLNVVGLYCWGWNSTGQLGLASTIDAPTPQAVNLPNVTTIEVGTNHSGAVAGGKLYLWGENMSGQLGDGTAVEQDVPKDIGLDSVEHLAFGDSHSCALTTNGILFCWGANAHGQIGDGSTTARSTPTAVGWP